MRLGKTTLTVFLALLTAAAAKAHAADGKAVSASQPWTRATPGGSTIGAAYVELSVVKEAKGDKLIGASSPAAGRIEIHTHTSEDGVMKMRKVESIAVLPGETRRLAPGGDHLMLFDLKAPLKQGERLPLTLKFESSGEISVEAVVESVGAMGPDGTSWTPTAADTGEKIGSEGSDAGSHEGSHDGSGAGSHSGE